MNLLWSLNLLVIIASIDNAMAMKRQQYEFPEGYQNSKKGRILSEGVSPINFVSLNELNAIELRQGQNGSQRYEIQEAYDLFITREMPNPFTREPLSLSQIERIKLFKQYYDRFGECSVSHEEVDALFVKYLDTNGLGLNDDEFLKLERWLLFDSSDAVFSNLGKKFQDMSQEDRENFQHSAANALKPKEIGSWIIRPSSIKDNLEHEIFIRTISLKIDIKTIKNLRLLHISKYGFCVELNEESTITSLDNFNVNDYQLKCFSSLTRLIEYVSNSFPSFALPKYTKIPEQGKMEGTDEKHLRSCLHISCSFSIIAQRDGT